MVLIIFSISPEFALISSIALIISCIFWLLSRICPPTLATSSVALWAFSAVSDTCPEISSILLSTSSMALACSTAPWLRSCAPMAICSEPLETWAELSTICDMVVFSLSSISFKEDSMDVKSPTYSCLVSMVRFPSEIASSIPESSPMYPLRRFMVCPKISAR